MSAYDELVERCARALCKANGRDPDAPRYLNYPDGYPSGICWHENIDGAKSALYEVLRTLQTVTPTMDAAWDLPGWEIDETAVARTFLAMFNASPLMPPKDTP